MELILLSKLEHGWEVHHYNGVLMGEIQAGEDGFYNFWPDDERTGEYWPAYMLRALADKLDELNKPWEEQIARDLAV